MVGVHTTAAQFHHAGAKGAQPRQIKFSVAIGSAHPLGLRGCEHPISPNDLLALGIAHQQVLAIVVKQIDIVAWNGGRQSSAHFSREDIEPQFLRLPDFLLVPGPGHLDSTAFRRRH
ncbi:hypothetical protein D3C71_1792380 [compost metagenome]